MSDDMCQTRQEIIEDDPQIQKAIRELEKLNNRETNGKTRQEILEYEILIETRIAGKQTSQDVTSIKNMVETLVADLQERKKYPSIVYQLTRLPVMGWSLLASTLILIWLVGQIPVDIIIKWLGAAHIEATPGDVHTVVAIVGMGLVVNGVRRYIQYVQDCEESGSLQ